MKQTRCSSVENVRKQAVRHLAILTIAVLFSETPSAFAAPLGSNAAASAVRGWLKAEARPLGATIGGTVQRVETFKDKAGQPLYFVVYLRRSGFVIVPADDLVEPIIGFAEQGKFDPSLGNPLGALVSNDLPGRLANARRHKATAVAGAASLASSKWLRFQQLDQAPTNLFFLSSPSDVRVAPLLQSYWDQSIVNSDGLISCYNYYTPPYSAGNVNNYVCGCVATAMAQLMRYWKYPTAGVGTAAYDIEITDIPYAYRLRGGDGAGGPYGWSNMPLVPGSGITTVQCKAIGALMYDAGLSVGMDYNEAGSGESSAFCLDSSGAFRNTFYYGNAVAGYNDEDTIGTGLPGMVNPNLDSGYPVLFGIRGNSGGHCIVCDGYGYNSSTLYHHLNMGWSGEDNAWYALPYIDAVLNEYTYTMLQECIYNVYTNGSGEIISGRVLTAGGAPVVSATVVATRSGGGTYSATTSAKGIYALPRIPSSSSYTITVSASGYATSTLNFSTGKSSDGKATSGNVWGANFTLSPASSGQADLTMMTDSLDDLYPDPGETVTAHITITNQSCSGRSENVGAFHVGFYWSSSSSFNGVSPFFEDVVSGCNANGVVSLDQGLIINTNTSPGTWYFGYKINNQNEVAECDPNNNGINYWTLTVSSVSRANLAVLPSPPNGGTVSGGGEFTVGSSEMIWATANSGWQFSKWNEDGSTANPRTVIVPRGGAIYTAIFVQTGPLLDHFAWSAIASPQPVNTPFAATITAQNSANATVTSFSGTVSLNGVSSAGTTLFSDNFENGSISDWGNEGGTYLRFVDTIGANGSSRSLSLIGGNSGAYDGVSHSFANLTPDRINFYIRSTSATNTCGYFVIGQSKYRSNSVAHFFMHSDGSMGLTSSDGNTSYTTSYIANQWYKISLLLNWTNKSVDYYVNDTLEWRGILFCNGAISSLATLNLYNYDNVQVWWDQIEFVQGSSVTSVAVNPATSGRFVNGVWSGNVSVRQAATNMVLTANDGAWHTGSSYPFNIVSGTVDRTPPTPNPSTWATVPYATGTASISMSATAASDPSGVQYFFHCLTYGGHDSGWQAGSTYQDTGLSPNSTYTYQVRTRDNSPNQNQGSYSISASATTHSIDTQGPALAITWPTNNATVTGARLTVSGTASDSGRGNNGVSSVTVNSVSADGGTASGSDTANWNATITLNPGANMITVVAEDALNNPTLQQVSVLMPVGSLTVTINPASAITAGANWQVDGGEGQKSGATVANLNLGNHTVGFNTVSGWRTPSNQTVSIKAKSVAITKGTYTFAAKGIYNGLFMVSNDMANVTEESAGMLRGLDVTAAGSYSGKLLLGGCTNAISGSFNVSGQASNHIARAAKKGPLVVEMTLNWSDLPPIIIGTVSGTNGGLWTADLMAFAASNTLPSAQYSMLLSATDGIGNLPPGDGYITMSNHAGTVTLNGWLADGTGFTQTAPTDASGEFPLYASLYGNTSLLLGWVNMASNPAAGQATWIRKSSHSAWYPNGFTNDLSLIGSVWTKPVAHTAPFPMDFSLSISGGNLISNLEYTFNFSSNGTLRILSPVAGPATNSLTGSLNPRTGLFKFIFGNENRKGTTTGTGVFLQDVPSGGGYFLGTTNGGAIRLHAD